MSRMECRLPVTDQPGRLVALCLVAPLLWLSGQRLLSGCDHNEVVGKGLLALAVIFWVYEAFWICRAEKTACFLR